MREAGGGGGATILIDPASLRRAGGRLQGVAAEVAAIQSALGSLDLPELPPSVAADVAAAILDGRGAAQSERPTLEDMVTELTRRAFWAEYADRLMTGYALSGPAKQEFLRYLDDGTLLRYASPAEAEAAGRELATVCSGFREDQAQLFQLALALRGTERSARGELLQRFSAGFVDRFGARNLLLVPRVIQAMEWSRAIEFGGSPDPHLLHDVARTWTDRRLQADPVRDLLAPFSVALANATLSNRLTRTVEDELADGEDTWSTAMLLSQGDRFDSGFLLRCFQTGVVRRIARDSLSESAANIAGEPAPLEAYPLGRVWSGGAGGLPTDTKEIVLEALARNPQAAALALTRPLAPVQVFDRMGNRVEVTDPVTLLYRYGSFADHGAAFGHAYAAATDALNANPDDAGAVRTGSVLTRTALHELLGRPAVPGPDQSAFADGVAHDLARHHVADLFESAVANDPGSASTVLVGPQGEGSPLRLSQAALTDVLRGLSARPSAFSTVLHAGSVYQAALIDRGTAQPPGSPADWAYKAAAFDASVLNAGDLHRLDAFDASDQRHRLIAGFFKDVVDDTVALDDPVAGAVVHAGVDAGVDSLFPPPDPGAVIASDAQAKALLTNSLHAAIVAGYYDHGRLAGSHPPASILNGGRLVSYGSAGGNARFDYEEWMNGNARVEQVTRTAMQEASRAYQERSIDLIR